MESDSLNPLDVRAITNQRIEDFALSVPSMLYAGQSTFSKDPFWDNQAQHLIAAVSCGIMSSRAQPERNLCGLADLLFGQDPVYLLAKFLDDHSKEVPEFVVNNIGNFINTAALTRSGILATTQQHIKLLATQSVAEVIHRTSFELADFRDGAPMTIYLILPPTHLASHGSLLRMWLSTLLQVALSRRQMPAFSTHFFVDELAQIGQLHEIETVFTLMRGFGVRATIYLQDLQQLQRLYPNSWQTLLGNTGALQIFRPNTRIAAKNLRKLFPKALSTDDILTLGPDEQLVLTPGGQYERLRKLDYLCDPCFVGLYEANRFYAQRLSMN